MVCNSAVGTNIDAVLDDVGKCVFFRGIDTLLYPLTENYFVNTVQRSVIGGANHLAIIVLRQAAPEKSYV